MAIGTPVRSRTTFRFGPAPTRPLHSPTLTSDTRQDWRLVHKVAKDHESAILKATLEGFAKARATIDTDALALEIHKSGHAYSIDWQAISDAFASSFLPAISDTGKDAAITLLPSFKKQVQDAHPLARASEVFLDPPAPGEPSWFHPLPTASPEPGPPDAWAKLGLDLQHSGANDFLSWYTPNKITAVTSQIQGVIGSVIEGSFKNGVDVYYQANAIKHMIGLSGPQSTAYSNRTLALWNQGYGGAKINAMMEAWTQKAIQYRATVIARTESLRAANMGQKLLWGQANVDGLLDADKTSQVWIATPDDRECEICVALDGQSVDLDASWSSSVSGVTTETPPIHTSCRCAMGLVFSNDPSKQTPSATPENPGEPPAEPTVPVATPEIGDVPFPNYVDDVGPDLSSKEWGIANPNGPGFVSNLTGLPYVPPPARLTGEQFITKIEGSAWTDYAKTLSPEERTAFEQYSDVYFGDINGMLRDPNFFYPSRMSAGGIDKAVAQMDKAFANAPELRKDVDFFRNVESLGPGFDLPKVPLDKQAGEFYAEAMSTKWKGMVLSDKAFLSTTVDPAVAFPGRNVQITIETPKGTKVVYLDKISKNKGELEALFPRGAQLQIKDVEFTQRYNQYAGHDVNLWKVTVRLILPLTP